MPRIYVQKNDTGAIWSSVIPELGVWKKEFMGAQYSPDTKPAGSVVDNFYPFSKKNRRRFTLLERA